MATSTKCWVWASVLVVAAAALPAHAIDYSYDGLDRLTRVVYDNGITVTYAYDPAGNILKHEVPEPAPFLLQTSALAAFWLVFGRRKRKMAVAIKRRRVCVTLAALAGTFVMAAPVRAAEKVWTLTSIPFVGGGQANGTFVYDAATQEVKSWDITVDAAPPFAAFRYLSGLPEHTWRQTNTGSLLFNFRDVTSTPGSRELYLFHAAPLLTDDAPTASVPEGGEVALSIASVTSTRDFDAAPHTLTSVLVSTATPDEVVGGCRTAQALQAADPVNLLTGAFTYNASLLSETSTSEQPFEFKVFYDSGAAAGDAVVGRKWTHSYEWRLEGIGNGSPRLKVVRGDGAADFYEARWEGGVTTYAATYPQTPARLEADGDGTFTYTDPERSEYAFDALGRLEFITDRNGQTSTLSYDGNGRLASFVGPAPASHRATFGYDLNDRITSVDYRSGLMHVALTYDAFGNLASFSSPTNPAMKARFTYDGAGNILTGTAGTGAVDDVRFVKNTYVSGKVVSQVDAMNHETKFAYDPLKTTITDPSGGISTRTFDEAGRISGATNTGGADFSWSYGGDGKLTRVDGPRGFRTMSYAPSGNLMGMTLENGDSMGLTWDADSNLTGVTDGNGNVREYAYDESGNLNGFANAIGNGTSYQHDSDGRLTVATDPNGQVTSTSYNAMGDLDEIDTATGPVSFTYDAMGHANSVTDQNGRTTSVSIDATGAVKSRTDAMGRETKLTHDAFGQLTKEEAPDGGSVVYERDAVGRITATIDPAGNRVSVVYDQAGRIASKTSPTGATTHYEYHANGELERTIDAMGGATSATFTAAGQKQTVTNANGKTIQLEYDALGRVSVEIDPLSRRTQTFYDSAGSISQVTNARSESITYGYDPAGQLITTGLPGDTIHYELNPEGKRTAATHDAGTTSVVYDDALGGIATRTDELGNEIGYGYDAVGNLTTLTYSDGKTVTYTYDELDRMTKVTDWAGRTTTYTYTPGGSLASRDLPDGSSVSYEYDAAGHLTAMPDKTKTGATIISGQYTYDAAGRTKSANVSLPLDPTPSPETRVFTYDAANQIATVDGVPFGFDADGNMTSGMIEGVQATLVYDAQNRLLQHNSDLYRYDTDNFRIEATRGGVTTRYVWDGTSRNPRLLEEQDSTGAILARYVHGIGLIGREDAATGALSVYHFDVRGSTVALTNPAGVITDRYAYDPYGKVVGSQGSTPNPFRYGGRDGVFDDGHGVLCMTSRCYIPSLGRFAQQESIYRGSLFKPATLNRYAYADGNPIDRIDPRGEFWTAAFAVIGAVTSMASQIVDNVTHDKPWTDGLAGAALSGAISGAALTLGPWGQAAAGIVASGLGNGLNQVIANKGFSGFDFADMGTDMAVGAATGFVTGKLFPTPRLPTDQLATLTKKFAIPGTFRSKAISGIAGKGAFASVAPILGEYALINTGTGTTGNLLGSWVLKPHVAEPLAGYIKAQTTKSIISDVGVTLDGCALEPSSTVYDRWSMGAVSARQDLTEIGTLTLNAVNAPRRR